MSFDNSENPFSTGHAHDYVDADKQLNIEGVFDNGKVGHVFALGILTVVNGAAAFLFGAYLVVLGVAFPVFLKQMQQTNPQINDLPPEVLNIIQIGMVCVGAWMSVFGICSIIAGIQTCRFRWRRFAMTMHFLSITTLFSFYCLPTSICLAIYGLIVLFNQPVKLAFQFGQRGHAGKDIQQAFARLPMDSQLYEKMRDVDPHGF